MLLKNMFVIVCFVGVFSCSKNPDIDHNYMLDGQNVVDSALIFPQKYLTSQRYADINEYIKNKPVLIVSHGYSATTFEWKEFFEWHDTAAFEVSLVSLGGHGRTYDDFKKSTWQDWQSAIIDEYKQLVALGYRNISFVGSSTSGPLLLQLLQNDFFSGKIIPRNIILVDPIIVGSNKLMSLAGVVGPFFGYVETEMDEGEVGYWYNYRPQETVQQLQQLLDKTRKDLQKGILLPSGCNLTVYKSVEDDSADPIGAALIYGGVEGERSEQISIKMVDSHLHVFTRLAGRKEISENDLVNQIKTFEEIRLLVE